MISVITIVKNNQKTLPRAIESVLDQTLIDFEYIIVNDGSSDGTKNLINTYAKKDRRIKPMHLPKNVGRAMARNTGLERVKGDYVFFIDADDYLPSNALKDLFETAEKQCADIVFGGIKCFDQLTGNWHPTPHYTHKIIDRELHGFRLDDHLDLIDNHHIVGRLFRQEMLRTNNIFFSRTRKNGEDVLFAFFTSFHARKISMIPEKISYYYSIGNYLAAASESKLFDARDNILETIEFSLKNGSESLKKRMMRKAATFAGSLERAQAVYGSDSHRIIDYIKSLLPFVTNLSEEIIKDLPPYFKNFSIALRSKNFQKAYHLWQKKNPTLIKKDGIENLSLKMDTLTMKSEPRDNTNLKKELEVLKRMNKELAFQLDEVYNSLSWRITAPLRRLSKPFFKGIENKKGFLPRNVQSKPEPSPIKPGFDLSLELSAGGYGRHRSGWKAVAIESLMPLHNLEALYLVSFLEKIFLWGEPKRVVFPRPWIGFTHRPHNIPSFFPDDMRRLFYQNPFFKDVEPSCRGIFTLSKYHAKHISKKLAVPVESLMLPTEIPERQWNPSSLSKSKTKVVQVGWWLRKLHAIFMLPSGDYEKIYLTKREVEPVDRFFSIEAQYLKEKNLFKDSMYDTAKTIDLLPNDEYDKLLAECVIFLDLYDSSANNAVVEAIARATPVVVNPLEPIVEYLGVDYPLYYNSYDQAREKLHDKKLLLTAHEYLKICPTRQKLSGEYFKNSLLNSNIYKTFLKEIGK